MPTINQLLDDAIDEMAAFHDSIVPDEDCHVGMVPPEALRRFVDAHARLVFERAQIVRIEQEQAVQQLCRGRALNSEVIIERHKQIGRQLAQNGL